MRHAQCMDAADREIDQRHCGTRKDREVGINIIAALKVAN